MRAGPGDGGRTSSRSLQAGYGAAGQLSVIGVADADGASYSRRLTDRIEPVPVPVQAASISGFSS